MNIFAKDIFLLLLQASRKFSYRLKRMSISSEDSLRRGFLCAFLGVISLFVFWGMRLEAQEQSIQASGHFQQSTLHMRSASSQGASSEFQGNQARYLKSVGLSFRALLRFGPASGVAGFDAAKRSVGQTSANYTNAIGSGYTYPGAGTSENIWDGSQERGDDHFGWSDGVPGNTSTVASPDDRLRARHVVVPRTQEVVELTVVSGEALDSFEVREGGSFRLKDAGSLTFSQGSVMRIRSGGACFLQGKSEAEPVILNAESNSSFLLEVDDGAFFDGEYALVDHGVCVLSPDNSAGALFFSLRYSDLIQSGNSSLLDLRNLSGGSLLLDNNAWVQDLGAGFNVRASAQTPLVTIFGSDGNFSGAGFEDDPADRIAWAIGEPNLAPVVEGLDDIVVRELEAIAFRVIAQDQDSGGVRYAISNALGGGVPQGMSVDASSGFFSWTPGVGQAGTYLISVSAIDQGVPERTTTRLLRIHVKEYAPAGRLPLSFALSDRSVASERLQKLELLNFTRGGLPRFYNYKLLAAPSFVSIEGSALSIEPATQDEGQSPFVISLEVDDGIESVSDTFSLSVVPALPAAPVNFSGLVLDHQSIQWSWDDQSDNEEGFLLLSASGEVVAEIAGNQTTFVEEGLLENTRYQASVVAFGFAGDRSSESQDFSASTLVRPPEAGEFEVVAQSSALSFIRLRAPRNEKAGLSGVKIERDEVASFDSPAYHATQGFVQEYGLQDQGVSAGLEYFYRFTYCNQDGVETPSFVVGPVIPFVEDYVAVALEGNGQVAHETGLSPHILSLGVTDLEGNGVGNLFEGASVEFEIVQGEGAHFPNGEGNFYRTTLDQSSEASSEKLQLDEVSQNILVEGRVDLDGQIRSTHFLIIVDQGAVEIKAFGGTPEVIARENGDSAPGLEVQVSDDYGNPLSGIEVVFSTDPPEGQGSVFFAGSLSEQSVVTGVDGRALSLPLEFFGQGFFHQKINASVPEALGALSISFEALGHPAEASSLPTVNNASEISLEVIQEDQEREPGEFYTPFGVRVLDTSGDPIPNVFVTLRNIDADEAGMESHYLDSLTENFSPEISIGLSTHTRIDSSTSQYGVIAPLVLNDVEQIRTGHRVVALSHEQFLISGGRDGSSGSLASSLLVTIGQECKVEEVDNLLLREEHQVVVLDSNRVLILGGIDAAGQEIQAAEIYDPETGSVDVLSGLPARRKAGVKKVSSGRFVIAGGFTSAGPALDLVPVADNGGLDLVPETPLVFPDGEERHYPDLVLDSQNQNLWVVGSEGSPSGRKVLRYAHSAGVLSLGVDLDKVLGGGVVSATLKPTSAAVLTNGNMLMAGVDGVILLDDPSKVAAQVLFEEVSVFGDAQDPLERVFIHALPSQSEGRNGLETTPERFLFVGSQASKLGRFSSNSNPAGLFPAPDFDDVSRAKKFVSVDIPFDGQGKPSPYGYSMVFGGEGSTTFESFTQPQARFPALQGAVVPSFATERTALTDRSGRALFLVQASELLGRQSFQYVVYPGVFGPFQNGAVLARGVVNQYAVDFSLPCPAPGQTPSHDPETPGGSGGGGSGGGGEGEGEEDPNLELPPDRGEAAPSAVVAPLNGSSRIIACVDRVTPVLFDVHIFDAVETPPAPLNFAVNPELPVTGDWDVTIRAPEGEVGDKVKIVGVNQGVVSTSVPYIYRFELLILGLEASSAVEDVELTLSLNVPDYGVITAYKYLTAFELQLDACPGDIYFLKAHQPGVYLTLVGPQGLIVGLKLEELSEDFDLIDPSNVLESNVPTKIRFQFFESVSDFKRDQLLEIYLFTPVEEECLEYRFTLFDFHVEICGEKEPPKAPVFLEPDAPSVQGDSSGADCAWGRTHDRGVASGDHNSQSYFNKRAQLTPGQALLRGPSGCRLPLVVKSSEQGVKVLPPPRVVQVAGTPEESSFWVQAQDTSVSRKAMDVVVEFCVGLRATQGLRPSSPNKETRVRRGGAGAGSSDSKNVVKNISADLVSSAGSPGVFGVQALSFPRTPAFDPFPINLSPEQDLLENCPFCYEQRFTRVQTLLGFCDTCDEQIDDVVCFSQNPEDSAINLFAIMLGPDEYMLQFDLETIEFQGLGSNVGSIASGKLGLGQSQLSLESYYPGSGGSERTAVRKNKTLEGCFCPGFHSKIRHPNLVVVQVSGLEVSAFEENLALGLYLPCLGDLDSEEDLNLLERVDVGQKQNSLLVNLEALSVVDMSFEVCGDGDDDDLVALGGSAEITFDFSPSIGNSEGLKLVSKTPERVQVLSQGEVSESLQIKQGESVAAFGVERSMLPRDGRLVIENAFCADEIEINGSEGGTLLQLGSVDGSCAEAMLTVYDVTEDLPPFLCVQESDVVSFALSAPPGTPMPAGGISLEVEADSSGSPATWVFDSGGSFHTLNFNQWNVSENINVQAGQVPSFQQGDIVLRYTLSAGGCVTSFVGSRETVYEVQVLFEPLCLLINEAFVHPEEVSGEVAIVPGLPEDFEAVILENGNISIGNPAGEDVGLPGAGLEVLAGGLGSQQSFPINSGFGKREILVSIRVDGVEKVCGNASTELIVGGLPEGVEFEDGTYHTDFSAFVGVPLDLDVREVPLGLGNFFLSDLSPGISVTLTSEGLRVVGQSQGGATFTTNLDLDEDGVEECSVVYTVTFVRNQGPDCSPCIKPDPVGPLIHSPPTSGSPYGDENDHGDPVQLDRGDLMIARSDLIIPGRGFDFAHVRTYRGMARRNTSQGLGWDFGYNIRLEIDPASGAVALLEGDKVRQENYAPTENGQFSSPFQHFTSLSFDSSTSTYRLLQKNGMVQRFDQAGRLIEIHDTNLNRMSFEYGEPSHPDRLTGVVDTMGRLITYSYYPDTDSVVERRGRLQAITDFFARSVEYDYDSRGRLTEVTRPEVSGTSTGNDFEGQARKTERYTYYDDQSPVKDNLLFEIIQANENDARYGAEADGTPSYSFSYDEHGRVESQRWGDSTQVINYQYEAFFASENASRNAVVQKTTVTDREGNVAHYLISEHGQVVEKQEVLQGSLVVTQWKYNDFNQLMLHTRPEGNTIEYLYDDGIVELPSGPDVVDARLRSNLLEVVEYPGGRSADQNLLRYQYLIEPFYNQECLSIDPRGDDQGDNLSFTTRFYFDWEEGDNRQSLAEYLLPGFDSTPLSGDGWLYVDALMNRMKARGQLLGVGATDSVAEVGISAGSDLNADGVRTRIAGNPVRLLAPKVSLQSEQASLLGQGSTDQYISTLFFYNSFGQQTGHIDSEGNIEARVFYSSSNPSGGSTAGSEVLVDPLSISGGYLEQSLSDLSSSAAESEIVVARFVGSQLEDQVLGSFTSPLIRTTGESPVQQTFTYEYDLVGNLIRVTDPRGAATAYEVNALNQVVRETAPAPYSYATSYLYDANDNLIEERVENQVADLDPAGRLQISDNGEFSNLEILSGNPTTFVHRYEYDLLNYQTEADFDATKPDGTSLRLISQYVYDKNQNLLQIIEPEGNSIQNTYNERDLLVSTTQGFGSTEAATALFEYDGNKNIISIVDGTGDETLVTFDGYDRQQLIEDAEGNELYFTYDAAGNRLTSVLKGPVDGSQGTAADGAPIVELIRSFTSYDELSRAFEERYDLFDLQGNPILSGGPGFDQSFVRTLRVFDKNSRLAGLIEDDGAAWKYAYDGLNRRIEVEDPEGNKEASEYDKASNLIEKQVIHLASDGTQSETYTTQYRYDVLNRLTRTLDNLQNTSEYAYDSRNNLTHAKDALNNTEIQVYDGANRLVKHVQDIRDSGGAITDTIDKFYTYDANSRLTSVQDDLGHVTGYDYDALNRLIDTTYANTASVSLSYDQDDNVLSRLDQNGTLVTYTYDGLNRLTQRNALLPGGGTGVYNTENAQSMLVGTTDQFFQYDGAGRLTLASDNNDFLDPLDDSHCTYTYDSLSRLLEESQDYGGTSFKVSYDWVSDNRQQAVYYPGGNSITRSFDSLDRLQSSDWSDAADHLGSHDLAYEYIGPGRTLSRKVLDQVTRDFHDPNDPTRSSYDALARPAFLDYGLGAGMGLTYGHDAVSNQTFEYDPLILGTGGEERNLENYGYDSVYRLIDFETGLTPTPPLIPDAVLTLSGDQRLSTQHAQPPPLIGPKARDLSWTLDGVGSWVGFNQNGSARDGQTGSLNQYQGFDLDGDDISDFQLDHALNGNVIQDLNARPDVNNPGLPENTEQLEYEYDAFNRLRRVFDPDSGATYGEYDYDAGGRRIHRFADTDHDGSFDQDIRYIYDDKQVIEERETPAGDTLLRQYLYGNYLDEVVWSEDSASTEEYLYGQDENYNVYALYLYEQGTNSKLTLELYRYDAYGSFQKYDESGLELGSRNQPSDHFNPYLFQSRRFDPESSLYYYRARYHNLETGRFLSFDAYGYGTGSLNLYEFLGSSPLNYLDPNGDIVVTAAVIIVGGLIYAGVNEGIEYSKNKGCYSFDFWRFGKNFAIGSLVTGVGVATGGAAYAAFGAGAGAASAFGASALASGAESGVEQYLRTGSVDGGDLLVDTLVGGITGGVADNVARGLRSGAGASTVESVRAPPTSAERLRMNRLRGLESEDRVLNDLGLKKNTRRVHGREGVAIPDAISEEAFHEVKDVKRLSGTRQIRIMSDAALDEKKTLKIYTGERTRVAKKLEEEGLENPIRIRRRSDLGPGGH